MKRAYIEGLVGRSVEKTLKSIVRRDGGGEGGVAKVEKLLHNRTHEKERCTKNERFIGVVVYMVNEIRSGDQ